MDNMDSTNALGTVNENDSGIAQQIKTLSDNISLLAGIVQDLKINSDKTQLDLAEMKQKMSDANVEKEADHPVDIEVHQEETCYGPQASQPTRELVRKIYDLPTFAGEAEDWPLFYSNFHDTTNTLHYSHQENMIRLQKCLTGEAKEAVRSLLIFPQDVPRIMEELQFRFGRPDLMVRAQLSKIQELPQVTENKIELLIQMASKVRNVLAFLKSAKCTQHIANPVLLEQLVGKLPTSKQYDWITHTKTLSSYPSVEDFANWIGEIARVVCLLPIKPQKTPSTTMPNNGAKRVLHLKEAKRTCARCDGIHHIADCNTFREMTLPEKWEFVKRRRLCFSCLNMGHSVVNCRQKRKCGINGCTRIHHRSLHNERPSGNAEGQNAEVSNAKVLNCHTTANKAVLFKILPVSIYGPKGHSIVTALIDDGSAISLIDAKLAQELGLKGEKKQLSIKWFDNKTVSERSSKVNSELGPVGSVQRFQVNGLWTVSRLNLPEQSFDKTIYKHLKELPIKSYQNCRPQILLGFDSMHLTMPMEITSTNTPIEPVAARTKIGWVAYGSSKLSCQHVMVLHVSFEERLCQLMEDYFATENYGTNNLDMVMESDENRRARTIMENTTKRCGTGFETGLLWKKFPPQLPPSYSQAEKRLYGIEKKIQKNTDFGRKYREEMEKYFKRGYARVLMENEIPSIGPAAWYLPHFGVETVHKPDKVRIVFDAAAEIDGISLNSTLLKGPEQSQSLLGILFRFRQKDIGVAADIEEMFSQIKIRKEDQFGQRFLWRATVQEPIKHCVMTSMIFGAKCSPCTAEYIKNLNAAQFKSHYPIAVETIIKNHYVDDLVSSFTTEDEAIDICKQIKHIHKHGNFNLRNFVSNSKRLEEELNGKRNQIQIVEIERQKAKEKILGMIWSTVDDQIMFCTKFPKVSANLLTGERVPTKRQILSMIMSVFDPFGLLADFLIYLKVLMQEVWTGGYEWDEPVPENIANRWTAWCQESSNIANFKIPRCHSTYLFSKKVELHVFVDASQVAFAAVCYFRVEDGPNSEVSFVFGKTKTAPRKLMSVPRLELQAAVLGCRLAQTIKRAYDVSPIATYYWSDSKTVVQWIKSNTRRYRPFVAHRIVEILNHTKTAEWNWVSTHHNSADLGTRPQELPKYDLQNLWVKGPQFLVDKKDWPESVIDVPEVLEEEIHNIHLTMNTGESKIIDIAKYSSFFKLKRIWATVLRAVQVFRRKAKGIRQQPISVAEVKEAEKGLCRAAQMDGFPEEFTLLQQQKAVPKQSAIYKLSPYMAEDGLLRVDGRIDEAEYLPYETRRPAILPYKHAFTDLVVTYFHDMFHHQCHNAAMNEIRQRYWIPHLKVVLNKIKSTCVQCIMDRATPKPPRMGSLPQDRIVPYVKPFSYCGVDLFGPYNVSVGRRREKRWGVLFTCLTTRAVHIELATDLSADAFIICFRNFVNRRGTPVRMRSDNGTNFIGAKKELQKENRLFDLDKIEDEVTSRNIEWIFNCPNNPSSGGCWERLIGIVKRLLTRTLRDQAPRVETLNSVLIEAENILNSRPLVDVPVSTDTDEAFTPNHFLMGCTNSTQTPHPNPEELCLRKQWRISQNLKDRLWNRWVKEYLPQLLHRSKWHDDVEPIQVGQLVLIFDANLARRQWQKGRVAKLYPNKDGRIRFVDIQTSSGVLRRPVTKLAILKIE